MFVLSVKDVKTSLGASEYTGGYAFVVRPPWWQTLSAFLAYFPLGLGLLYLIFYFVKRRWMLQSALAREQEEAARLKELDSLKTRFFTNVSHELRTPLTLVLGPITSLLKEKQLTDKQKKLLQMAGRSVKQLEHLITEILDLGKLDMGKMQLNEQPTPLSRFFHRYLAQFESLVQRKSIDFSFDIHPDETLLVSIDRAKCRQILYNLLSNAFKFTPAGGTITAYISVEYGFLTLAVADSGPGIHSDDQPYLFDRFFQTNRPDKPVEGGTGIGLALCHEYAQLFGGKIEVAIEPGEGALFRVSFPVTIIEGSLPEKDEERVLPESLPDNSSPPSSDGISTAPAFTVTEKVQQEKAPAGKTKPTILVVEDNPELQDYLRLILSKKYEVITADNGRSALELLAVGTWQVAGTGRLRTGQCRLLTTISSSPTL